MLLKSLLIDIYGEMNSSMPWFDEVSQANIKFGYRRGVRLWEHRLLREQMKWRCIELGVVICCMLTLYLTTGLVLFVGLALYGCELARVEGTRFKLSGKTYCCKRSIEMCGL
jgi:hypothetical protein